MKIANKLLKIIGVLSIIMPVAYADGNYGMMGSMYGGLGFSLVLITWVLVIAALILLIAWLIKQLAKHK